MAQYVKQFGGYIADVPKLFFKRCDGRVFTFDELTQASVTPNMQFTEINAGWSLYPVAYIPGQSTFEAQITSGKFEAELFAMANNVNFQDNANYQMPAREHGTPDTTGKVVLGHAPVDGTIAINGLVQVAATETLASGQFQLDDDDEDGKTIKFYMGNPTGQPPVSPDIPVGTEVEIYYEYVEANAKEALINNQSSAIGEAIMVWPVYPSGDDCNVGSAALGNVIMKIFRCRVTAAPGFDSSYKSANTFQFTLAAMDPKRNDGNVYSITYIKNA